MGHHRIGSGVAPLGTICCLHPSLTNSSIVYKLPGVCGETRSATCLGILLLTVFTYKYLSLSITTVPKLDSESY